MATDAGVSIRLAEYDTAWPELYAAEASALCRALGPAALRLEHVGSTSVPGLAAKPTLDILLEVADSGDEAAYAPELEAAGYIFRLRELHWHEHRLFVRPQPPVNLHVFSRACPESDRMLRFRDRLRGHAGDRELYQRTKQVLAQTTWESVDAYAAAKTAVVEAILARAGGE